MFKGANWISVGASVGLYVFGIGLAHVGFYALAAGTRAVEMFVFSGGFIVLGLFGTFTALQELR